MPAAAHHYIDAAELSRALEVSPYSLAKLVVRGKVPPPDGFLRGKEIWNGDRIPAIKAAIGKQEAVNCESRI
jgi:hypothetical protein